MNDKERQEPPADRRAPERVSPLQRELKRIHDPFVVFTEWDEQADTEAYADLSRKLR